MELEHESLYARLDEIEPSYDQKSAQLQVINDEKAAREQEALDAIRRAEEAKLAFEAEQAAAKAKAAAEAEAKRLAEEKAKRDAEIAEAKRKEEEALAAAERKANEMANLQKTDARWIALRQEFINEQITIRLQKIEQAVGDEAEQKWQQADARRQEGWARTDARRTELQTELADMQIQIEQLESSNNEINDSVYILQDALYNATDEEGVNRVADALREAGNGLKDGYKQVDKLYTQRGIIEEELGGLDEENWIAELKLESDAVKEYIRRYKEEITAEEAKVGAAAGSDDLDLVTAESKAVVEWYTQRLKEKQEESKWRLEEYERARKNRDQQIQRSKDRLEIQREQNALNASW